MGRGVMGQGKTGRGLRAESGIMPIPLTDPGQCVTVAPQSFDS